jgi:hypothetical protein
MTSSKSLPPGAHSAAIPGSKASEAMKGLRPSKPVQIDHSFVADPKGGPYLAAPHGIEVRDNRTHVKR